MARTSSWSRTVVGDRVFSFFWQQGAAALPFFQMLLILLLSVDLALILLHVLRWNFETFQNSVFSIEHETGYGEFYQAIKGGWIAIIFGLVAWSRRMRGYFAWSAFFLYLTLDDFFEIHETVGLWLANTLQLPAMFGLRAVDFGELLVYGLIALGFLPIFILAYLRGKSAFRRDTKTLVGLVGVMAIFAVVVDMIHSLFATTVLSDPLGALEDGGEMVMLSIIVWFAFLVLARDTLAPKYK